MNLDEDALALIREAAVEAKRSGRGPGPSLTRLVGRLPDGAGITLDFEAAKQLGAPLVVLRSSSRPDPIFDGLSRREREVAGLLARGLRNKEIASALAISLGTVKDHVHCVLTKTGLDNRTAVAARWRPRPVSPPDSTERLATRLDRHE